MNVEDNDPSILECKECGGDIPEELFENLIKGDPIYCEKCGAQINREDIKIQIESHQLTEKTSTTFKDIFGDFKKKSIEYTKKKLRQRYKRIKEKPQN
jgi:NAD-dependent SIR2 family protein deacetylase